MFLRKRICGLAILFFGIGLLVGLFMEVVGLILAALLICLGFWLLFF